MKIGYIAPSGVFGGVRIVVEHVNRLAARGHECVFLFTDAPVNWLPVRAEQRPLSDPGQGYERIVGTAVTTWPVAKQLAEANNAAAWGLLQMAEWLFAVHESDEQRATMEAFTTPMDGVMAISDWLVETAHTIHAAEKVHAIRNGIDTALFYPDPIAEIRKSGEFIIVTEGFENGRAKDIGGMVRRALNRFRWDIGAKYRLIGFSQFKPTMEYDAFWTRPGQNDIRRILSSGDVFLKASRFEGRPGPDMEAMACGVPVCRAIITGGDDLRHNQNALVTDYWDDDEFLNNLWTLYKEPETRARLREAGLKYVREQYDWPTAIDTIEETLTGTVTTAVGDGKQSAYSLESYNALQDEIMGWETPQAEWLATVLNDELAPATVIDIGCGPGTYLVPFQHTAKVLGVDGAPKAGLLLRPDEYVAVDLRKDESMFDISRAAIGAGIVNLEEWAQTEWAELEHIDSIGRVWRADLALCVETAEHLPPDRADWLVELLTAAARVVFWSAAQPGQGGTGHLNEQPREWWLEKFKARGFDLHPRHEWLANEIANNEHCQRVRWLIGNAMLLAPVEK